MKKAICWSLMVLVVLAVWSQPSEAFVRYVVRNGDVQEVSKVLHYVMGWGNWRFEDADDYHMEFSRIEDDMWTMIWWGSNFNMHPEARVRLELFEGLNGVEIGSSYVIVTNPGSGYEHSTPLSDENLAVFNSFFLKTTQIFFDGGIASGIVPGHGERNEWGVLYVFEGSSAWEQGIRRGDVLVRINRDKASAVNSKRMILHHLYGKENHSFDLEFLPGGSGPARKVKIINGRIPPQDQFLGKVFPWRAGGQQRPARLAYPGRVTKDLVGAVSTEFSMLEVYSCSDGGFELKSRSGSLVFDPGLQGRLLALLGKGLEKAKSAESSCREISAEPLGSIGRDFKIFFWSENSGYQTWIEVKMNGQRLCLDPTQMAALKELIEQTKTSGTEKE